MKIIEDHTMCFTTKRVLYVLSFMFWSRGLDLFLTVPMILNIIPNNIYQKTKSFRLLPNYFPTTNPFEFT